MLHSEDGALWEPELITGVEEYKGELCAVVKWKDDNEITWEPLVKFLSEDRVCEVMEFLENGGEEDVIPLTWCGWPQWREWQRTTAAPDMEEEAEAPTCLFVTSRGKSCPNPLPCKTRGHSKGQKRKAASKKVSSKKGPSKKSSLKKSKKGEGKVSEQKRKSVLTYAARVSPTSDQVAKTAEGDALHGSESLSLKPTPPLSDVVSGSLAAAAGTQDKFRALLEGALVPLATQPVHHSNVAIAASPTSQRSASAKPVVKVHPLPRSTHTPHTLHPFLTFASRYHSSIVQTKDAMFESKQGRRRVKVAGGLQQRHTWAAISPTAVPSDPLTPMTPGEYTACLSCLHGSLPISFNPPQPLNPADSLPSRSSVSYLTSQFTHSSR
jgi:hypothetical protein